MLQMLVGPPDLKGNMHDKQVLLSVSCAVCRLYVSDVKESI